MSIQVKSAADAAKKWTDVTPGRASYYQAGAENAGNTWASNTAAAAASYKAAVSSANVGQLFAGGVKKAGADKYNRKVKDVGVARFSQGVQAAAPDYQTGVDPYLQTISGITLQARAPRGSAANLQRVTQIASALNAKRLALRAAGQ